MQQGDKAPEVGAAEIEQFMAIAAHDVRNPVAVVRASAQMAQRSIARGDAKAAQNRLAAIVQQTDRMTDMLETFLDAARIASGNMQLRREAVEVQELADAAVDQARQVAGDRASRALKCAVPDGLVGTWDRVRVVRALRALIANALLYGDRAAPVRIVAQQTDSRVHIAVSGGGAGPDAEEDAHLFERFYRGRSAAEAGQSGSGLGLYTARGVARLHGGEVRRVEGDWFEIELPLSDDA